MVQEYGKVSETYVDAILFDFQRRIEDRSEITRADIRFRDRELSLKEREQAQRFKESDDDIEVRRSVIGFGKAFSVAVLVAILMVVFFAPVSDSAKFVTATALVGLIAIPIVAIVVRGRLTQNERDVYVTTLPNRRNKGEPAKDAKMTESDTSTEQPPNVAR
jgi:hypothetical protein